MSRISSVKEAKIEASVAFPSTESLSLFSLIKKATECWPLTVFACKYAVLSTCSTRAKLRPIEEKNFKLGSHFDS